VTSDFISVLYRLVSVQLTSIAYIYPYIAAHVLLALPVRMLRGTCNGEWLDMELHPLTTRTHVEVAEYKASWDGGSEEIQEAEGEAV